MDFGKDIETVRAIAAVPTILDVASKTTGMGFTAVARVTEDRWITCASKDDLKFGLKPGDELKVETTICHEIRQSHEAVVIEDVAQDAAYCNHHTPAMYGFRSYISVPIILADGSFFGTLCAIDPRPLPINTAETVGMFKVFAELIAFHLDAASKLDKSSVELALERKNRELREQFIAVLGHDLRNPLASIAAGVRLLGKRVDGEGQTMLALMQGSVLRMSGLIDNVMDFARGRLGGGIRLKLSQAVLEPLVQQVVGEFAASHPNRVIEVDVQADNPVTLDQDRVAQLLSNLLGNALTYGAPDKPIQVAAQSTADAFELSVTNQGPPISPETMPHLFTAFERGNVQPNQKGLGLGLYISQEIARSHGGRIEAQSGPGGTTFKAIFPIVEATISR